MKRLLMIAAALTFGLTSTASAREQMRVVGSSTVFPFSTAVAEALSRTDYKAPVIESTGTGGGFKLFCSGVGMEYPDVANASRAIKSTEVETCKANGVTPIEIKVGFDGIVVANSRESSSLSFTKKQLFLALAKQVVVNGELVANPYVLWSDIDPSLPSTKIEVLGPPPTSGTRDAFLELVMEAGAKQFPEIKALSKKERKAIAHAIREDGGYIEAGENDNLIIQKLTANPSAVGIFGFSFLDNNRDKIQGATIEGVEPEFENILEGRYSVSRSLYFYVKREHVSVVASITPYVELFLSENMAGEEGALVDKGLIPLVKEERVKQLNNYLTQTK